MTFEEVRRLALSPPGVEESTSYGAPAFKVGGKLLACQRGNVRTRDEGRTLVLFDVNLDERAMLVEADPAAFFFNDHFRAYPAVLVRLPAVVAEQVRPYLARSWKLRAPKRLLRECEASGTAPS